MVRTLFIVISLLLASCAGANRVGTPPARSGAVQRIFLDQHEGGGWDWYGTAWHLGNGRWMTAGHICDDIQTTRVIEVELAPGLVVPTMVPATSIKIGEYEANLIMRAPKKSDPKAVPGSWHLGTADDLCVLASYAYGPYLTLGQAPSFGDRVHYVGYPEGHLGIYEGLYVGNDDHTSRHGDGDDDMMFSGFAWGGASGSPVMDSSGYVVGLLVSGYRGRPYTYAEPVASIRRFLKEI